MPDFVAHVGEERRLELVGLLGPLLGGDQLLLGLFERRDVVIDSQHVDHLLLRPVFAADEVAF